MELPAGPVPRAYLVAGVEAHVLLALFTVVVCVVGCVLGQPYSRRLTPHIQVLRLPGHPSICTKCPGIKEWQEAACVFSAWLPQPPTCCSAQRNQLGRGTLGTGEVYVSRLLPAVARPLKMTVCWGTLRESLQVRLPSHGPGLCHEPSCKAPFSLPPAPPGQLGSMPTTQATPTKQINFRIETRHYNSIIAGQKGI